MANILVSTLLQLAIAFAIAGAVWFFFGRSTERFAPYVGLKQSPLRPALIGLALGTISAAILLQVDSVRGLAASQGSVIAGLREEAGSMLLPAIAIVALIKTSFTEELVFRGILAKRLINWLGFAAGNAIQALLFGAIHLLLLLIPDADYGAVALLAIFTATTGWFNGWMKERLADGSIVPGWIAHGTANFVAYSALAYGL